jgi:hypothetical protein
MTAAGWAHVMAAGCFSGAATAALGAIIGRGALAVMLVGVFVFFGVMLLFAGG